VFLLFVVGMEFRFEDIARPRYFSIATAGVVVPWPMGFGTAALFGFPFGGSMFIATALTATSIAITANILREMGKLNTERQRCIKPRL
jgi:Kef-type K+ transport system membrane component KefB